MTRSTARSSLRLLLRRPKPHNSRTPMSPKVTGTLSTPSWPSSPSSRLSYDPSYFVATYQDPLEATVGLRWF